MTNTDKQCSSCGGDCGKVCERENVVEPYNGEERMILNAQGCAECGKGSGYALYCVACHDEFRVWVGLTDEDIAVLRRNGAHSLSDADFRAIEARLKEKNVWKRDPRDMCGNE